MLLDYHSGILSAHAYLLGSLATRHPKFWAMVPASHSGGLSLTFFLVAPSSLSQPFAALTCSPRIQVSFQGNPFRTAINLFFYGNPRGKLYS